MGFDGRKLSPVELAHKSKNLNSDNISCSCIFLNFFLEATLLL